MEKNIVLCSDGTGNTAIKGRGTNVFKLYEAIDIHGHKADPNKKLQIAFYDDGVGTEKLKPLKLLGGAFGWGLSRNVKQLYAQLVRTYEPGDHLFLFGFSRGAFTIRTLAGMIADCGILDRKKFSSDQDLCQSVKNAYREYRRKYPTWLQQLFQPRTAKDKFAESRDAFRRSYSISEEQHAPDGKVTIDFVGVWDTVAAVGTPFRPLDDLINRFIFRFEFPDRRLNPQVKRACHALSIDDARQTFHPLLWDEAGETAPRIEQVWFPGAHSNVGGGYPKQGMSVVALNWMMAKAEGAGLRFIAADRQFAQAHQNPHDKLYNSRAGLASFYRYKPRPIGEICRLNHATPQVHISTIERIVQGSEAYSPGNIPRDAQFVYAEPPQSLSVITALIDSALAGKDSLLDDVLAGIALRQGAYWLSLLTLLVTAASALYAQAQLTGWLATINQCFSVEGLIQLAKHTLQTPGWMLAVALAYGIGWMAERQMQRQFSRFWHPLLPEMRNKLEALHVRLARGQSA